MARLLPSILSALVLITIICNVCGQGIGFKTTVSQSGLNYLNSVGMQVLQQQLANIAIPDLSGDSGTPIGSVSWELTGIVLSGTQLPATTITPVLGTGISIAIANLGATVNMNWQYREDGWPHVSDSGTATVTVSGTDASISLQVYDSNGRPQVNVLSDALNVGNLDIQLHGGASWLYNFFISVLHDLIKNSIQNALQGAISSNIQGGLNQALATWPITAVVDQTTEINYEQTSNPTFTASYITINSLGEFYDLQSPQECPSTQCTFNLIPDTVGTLNTEVQLIASDFVANSAGFAYWQAGRLHATINDDQVPSYSPIRLNTTYFKYLIPPLYQKYPNNLMQLYVTATSAPQSVFTAQGADVNTLGNMEVSVIEANGTVTPVFTLTGSVALAGTATLSNNLIIGNLSFVTTNFTLQSTQIGPFNAATLGQLINMFFSQGIVPDINQLLQQGIPLPVIQGLTLVSPGLVWGDHYLAITSNINYVPPMMGTLKELQQPQPQPLPQPQPQPGPIPIRIQ